MLHDSLSEYLLNIERSVKGLKNVHVERYEEEIVTDRRINLRLRIRFLTGHLLEINEAVISEKSHIRHLGYRYHFQDGGNHLIFRYDDTPHFPDLDCFPYHKHTIYRVSPASKPNISDVFSEIEIHLESESNDS